MKSKDFIPTAWCRLYTNCVLQICTVREGGEVFVYSAFYDDEGNRQTPVLKSLVREGRRGHYYFLKNRQRHYLKDFKRIPCTITG